MDDDGFRSKPDSEGVGQIISGPGWATHVHLGNDLLDRPWRRIEIEKTGETFDGFQNRQEFFDAVLPDWIKK